MSGICCKCGEQTHPVEKRNWILVHYKRTATKTFSDYSEVKCLTCGARWQTKAKYVDELINRRYSTMEQSTLRVQGYIRTLKGVAKQITGCVMTSAALKLRKSRRRCEK